MSNENADQNNPDHSEGTRARDPVTGTTAKKEQAASRDRSRGKTDPEEIQQDIRRTRAQMSDTVDALEHRLSPERLKNEAKGAVHDTIDEVRYRYNPQRLANKAKRNMLETVREHPLSALTASLSIGYLLMKSGESRKHRDYDRSYGRHAYRPRSDRYDDPSFEREMDYESDEYRRARGYSERSHHERSYEERSHDDRGRSMRDRAGDAAEDIKHRASDTAEHAQETAREAGRRVQEAGHYVGDTAREAGHRMEYGARRAGSEIEDFVTGNPLAAGAVAVGVGALLGGMFPSTRTEDRWMGRTRDEAAHRAAEATRETMDQVRESAEHVGEHAAEAAGEVKRKAQEEAEDVKDTARQEARNVKSEAGKQAKEKTTN